MGVWTYVIWASSGLGAVVSFLLAVWVLSEGPRNRATRLFGWTIITIAFWGLLEFELRTAPDLAAATFWVKLLPLGWAWSPLLFLLFALEFTRHPLRQRPWVRWLWGIPLALIGTNFVDHLLYLPPRPMWWGWAVSEGPLWPLAAAYFGIFPLLALGVLFQAMRRTRSHQRRRQYRVILIGALMPYLPAVLINGLLPLYTALTGVVIPIPGMAFVGAFLMSLVIAVGVVRYQVFRADSPGVLEAVFQSVEEGIILIDQRGFIRLYSPALLEIFALNEEVLGLPFHDVFTYEEAPLKVPGIRLVRCLLNDHRAAVLERRNPVRIDRKFLGEVILWVGAEETLRVAHELRDAMEQLQELAFVDPLTRVYNRRYLEERLQEAQSHYARYRVPSTLILLDLDNFKEVNDTLGHTAGDALLQEFAQFLQHLTRRGDLVFRYGGDEFCILLPNTPLNGALRLASRIMESLQQRTFQNNAHLQVSMGIAEVSLDDPSPQAWLERADRALYRAKRKGRGCVMVAHAG